MDNIIIKNQYQADELKEHIDKQFGVIKIKNNTDKPIILPENIKCDFFDAEYQKNFVLPENLQSEGFVDISLTDVKYIPESLNAKLGILCTYINGLYIPDNFSTGSINLYQSKNVVLPKNLNITGHLNLVYSDVYEIPEGTYIGKNVVFNANIKNIGEFYGTLQRNSIFIGAISWKVISVLLML